MPFPVLPPPGVDVRGVLGEIQRDCGVRVELDKDVVLAFQKNLFLLFINQTQWQLLSVIAEQIHCSVQSLFWSNLSPTQNKETHFQCK